MSARLVNVFLVVHALLEFSVLLLKCGAPDSQRSDLVDQNTKPLLVLFAGVGSLTSQLWPRIGVSERVIVQLASFHCSHSRCRVTWFRRES